MRFVHCSRCQAVEREDYLCHTCIAESLTVWQLVKLIIKKCLPSPMRGQEGGNNTQLEYNTHEQF